MNPQQAEQAKTLAEEFVQQQGANTTSALIMGRVLFAQRQAGISDTDFRKAVETAGGTPPSLSRCSVYRSAYTNWCESNGVAATSPILARIGIDALYHAGRLIGRAHPDKPSVISPSQALSFARNLSEKELRAMVRTAKANDPEPERDEGLRSTVITVDAQQALEAFAKRLANAVGATNLSRSAALLFALEQVNTLNDESLDYLWREAHGEVDESERSEVVTLDVIDDEHNTTASSDGENAK